MRLDPRQPAERQGRAFPTLGLGQMQSGADIICTFVLTGEIAEHTWNT